MGFGAETEDGSELDVASSLLSFTPTQATQPVMESQDEYPSGNEDEVPSGSCWGKVTHTARSAGSGRVEFVDDSYIVGRAKELTIRLDDLSISNIHAKVYREGRTAFIKALGQNGTYLNNGRKLVRKNAYELRDGDVISFVRAGPPKSKNKPSISKWFELKFEACGDALLPHSQGSRYVSQSQGNSASHGNGEFTAPQSPLCAEMEAHYALEGQLGYGAFAKVYRVVHRDTGQACAVKIVAKKQFRFQSPKLWIDQLNEAKLLQRMNHENIAKLYEIFEDENALYLVMELLRGGELFDRILKGPYPENRAKILVRNILQAVDYLHDNDVLHRDLKPENIMLVSEDDDVNVKLVDFGVAKEERGGRATVCGTVEYIAPEVLERGFSVMNLRKYGKAADMWSIGVVVYVLLTATALFPSNTKATTTEMMQEQVNASMESEDWHNMKLSVLAQDFVLGLLEVNESRRLTAKRALNHPWILSIEIDQVNAGLPVGAPVALPCVPLQKGPSSASTDAVVEAGASASAVACTGVGAADSSTGAGADFESGALTGTHAGADSHEPSVLLEEAKDEGSTTGKACSDRFEEKETEFETPKSKKHKSMLDTSLDSIAQDTTSALDLSVNGPLSQLTSPGTKLNTSANMSQSSTGAALHPCFSYYGAEDDEEEDEFAPKDQDPLSQNSESSTPPQPKSSAKTNSSSPM